MSDTTDIIADLRATSGNGEYDVLTSAAANELERLRKMLMDHGIDPDGEYIVPGGLRVDPPASKNEPDF